MTRYVTVHYSDSIEVRKPALGRQRGPSSATVLDPVRDATPDEWQATERLARSTAAREGWDSDGGLSLADVLDELGF